LITLTDNPAFFDQVSRIFIGRAVDTTDGVVPAP
jgi:hypothetical protein